jgi:hypothetical protein
MTAVELVDVEVVVLLEAVIKNIYELLAFILVYDSL